eukprot:Tbor_TRINITY_DN4870_c0_g1::TRINITY_DN4870_c0_g1_i1::g.1300::m.1300
MADEEIIEDQYTVPEMWELLKPAMPEEEDEEGLSSKNGKKAPLPAPKIGALVKLLNDIEDSEELEEKIQEVDPATGHSILIWATLQQKFILVEWLVKKCKRAAFAFVSGTDNNLAIFDKWVEIRKEIEEKKREVDLYPNEENDEDEDREVEPTPEMLVYDALAEFHDDWGKRGKGLVKLIGELGIYQGARDGEHTKEGVGKTLFPNGDMYCGEYRSNKRHGYGTYYWASKGMLYTGKWKDNLREGLGRMVYPDGGRFLGNWVCDKCDGEGRYTYPDGSSYSGAWVKGVKNGFGTYTFTDGSQYIGAYLDGEFVSGEWRMSQGSTRYYGAFNDDVPVGAGVFVFKYGCDGSYRQEGTYTNGEWNPSGHVVGAHNTPLLSLVIQKKKVTLSFTEECAALMMEHLVQVSNFGPFIDWVSSLNTNVTNILLESVKVSSVKFSSKDKSVEEVRLKVIAKYDDGKRYRNTEGITLRKPTTRLMVILNGGSKAVCLLQKTPNASLASNEQFSLPLVRPCTSSGNFVGDFIRLVEPALRLELSKEHTVEVTGPVYSAAHTDSRNEIVRAYIRTIHDDAMTTLQSRLDEACANNSLMPIIGIGLSEVASVSTDAITIAAAIRVKTLMDERKLPISTVEEQRPPTPLPPAPEHRPDIEPLLAAERRVMEQARQAAAEEEE